MLRDNAWHWDGSRVLEVDQILPGISNFLVSLPLPFS